MTNDYIFFDSGLCDRFLRFVIEQGIPGETRADNMDGFVVTVPGNLADELEEVLEQEYETLMDEQRDLVDAAESATTHSLMAVGAQLPDGREISVRIPAAYARRLYAQFSLEEIRELVSAIAADAINPSDGPLCRKSLLSGDKQRL
ncbi:MAG: hypothetical protein K9K30_00635 [Burkholderiaceae bacterium]|nr:hypothetical protein [Sulfuritalea sp.]MCF8173734.1 hypothetical protein [Burkholderiaceae bacterium]